MKRTNTAKWMESQGRWQINVQKNGVRKSFTSTKPGRTGQREANAKADAWLEENVLQTHTRVSDLLNDYLEGVSLKTSQSNQRKETYHVERFIRPAIGKRQLSSLTPQDFQLILDKAFRSGKDGRELSKKTLMNIRATIMAFLKFCRKQQITTMLLEDLQIPKGARFKEKTILQPSDLEALFRLDTTILRGERAFDEYIYAYRFAVLTGLRPGELRGLRREDINGNQIYIRRSINTHNEETRGKNENAIRRITLSDLAVQILAQQLALSPRSDFIFDIASGSTFRHRWKRYCAANDIRQTSLYELRHTFISIVKTLPEGDVKSLVGHSKSMDTFGIYGHYLSGEDQRIAENVNDIFQRLLGVKSAEKQQ